jgi:hypothetical protein
VVAVGLGADREAKVGVEFVVIVLISILAVMTAANLMQALKESG